jgi:GNAT superfamily N-acetyltransferase
METSSISSTPLQPFDFLPNVVTWLKIGDPKWSFSHGEWSNGLKGELDNEGDVLRLEKTFRGHAKGLNIGFFYIRKSARRQGHSQIVLNTIEQAARELNLDFVIADSVISNEMENLLIKCGYTVDPYFCCAYIKNLK